MHDHQNFACNANAIGTFITRDTRDDNSTYVSRRGIMCIKREIHLGIFI